MCEKKTKEDENNPWGAKGHWAPKFIASARKRQRERAQALEEVATLRNRVKDLEKELDRRTDECRAMGVVFPWPDYKDEPHP